MDKGYISSKGASKGKINESLKRAIVNETVEVPAQYEDIKEEIINVIKKSTRRLPIENTKDKVIIKQEKEFY